MINICFIFILNIILARLLLGLNPLVLLKKIVKEKNIISSGQKLFKEVSSNNPSSVYFGTEAEMSLRTEYKFFTNLFRSLFELNRKLGAQINEPWRDLRHGLQKDLAFEKKLKAITAQAMGQMFVMSSFLILFALSFSFILETSLSGRVWGGLFLFIAGAWLVYFFALYTLKRYQWRNCSLVIKSLTSLDSMIGTGLSSIEILRKSKASELLSLRDQDFALIIDQLAYACDAWQKRGIPIKSQVKELSVEFWFVMEQKLEKLTKQVQALQLLCTFLFILPGFFYLITNTFLSFSGFLIE